MPRPGRRNRAAIIAVASLTVMAGGIGASGAGFTSETAVPGNAVTAAQIPSGPLAVEEVTAGSVELSWPAVPADGADVEYILTRTGPSDDPDADPVQVYSGTETSALDLGQIPVPDLDAGLVQLSAASHAVAVDSKGDVWAWGVSTSGRLGLGPDQGDTNAPMPVTQLPDGGMSQVSAGGTFTLAIASDGSLWSWGSNVSGALGVGDDVSRSSVPLPAEHAGPPLAQVSAGNGHALAVDTEGTVWAWGSNLYGQLGLGEDSAWAEFQPASIAALSDVEVTQISAGVLHSLAVDSDGQVWAWGLNDWGDWATTGTTLGSRCRSMGCRTRSCRSRPATGSRLR